MLLTRFFHIFKRISKGAEDLQPGCVLELRHSFAWRLALLCGKAPCSWCSTEGGSTCPVVSLPPGLQMRPASASDQDRREWKAGTVPPQVSTGASHACRWKSPLKADYNKNSALLLLGRAYYYNKSSGFAGSLLNSGRKGKNDSEVTWLGKWSQTGPLKPRGQTEMLSIVGKMYACFWYLLPGLESQPCLWKLEMKLESYIILILLLKWLLSTVRSRYLEKNLILIESEVGLQDVETSL